MTLHCAICEREQLVRVACKDSKSGEPLHVFHCGNCGLVQQAPLPDEKELQRYYSELYRIDYKGTRQPRAKHVFRAARCAKQRLDFLIQSGIRGGSLLDIGAGGGEFVAMAHRAGFDASGLEPNEGYAEYARSEHSAQVRTGNLADAVGRFQVVTLFHVLEHLRTPLDVFKQLHALIEPDGRLFIEVPWALSGAISPANRYFKAHLFYFDADTLAAAASAYFDVLAVDTTENLRMLLAPKTSPQPLTLPPLGYAALSRRKLVDQGWIHYLTSGLGWLKPAKIIQRWWRESRIQTLKGKDILALF